MRCPRCRELSPEGAAICDNCDEILDSSFLGEEEITPAAGEKTDVGPAPTPSPMPARLRKGSGRKPGGWNATGAPPAQPAAGHRPYLAEALPARASPAEDARKAAADLVSFFRSLSVMDRWAAGAASLLLLLLAMPWRSTREDDDIIGVVSAWPLLILGAAVLLLVYARASRADAALGRRLQLAQLAAAGCAVIFNGLYLPWASQTKTLHAAGHILSVPLSTPQFGAYLGLVCAVAALFASVPALRGEDR